MLHPPLERAEPAQNPGRIDEDLSHLSSSDLADKTRDAIIDREAHALDRAGEEMSRRARKGREAGSAFQKIAKEHREKWQRRAKGG